MTAAPGVRRNAELAAMRELMRVAGPIAAGRVRGGGFDAARELARLTPPASAPA